MVSHPEIGSDPSIGSDRDSGRDSREAGLTNVEVNKQQRRDVSTSRRLNVAMSARFLPLHH